MEFVFKFISSLFMMSIVVYSWHRLLEKKFNTKSIKLYIVIAILSLCSIINYYFINQNIRICTITILLVALFQFLFKSSIQKAILTPIYTQIVVMISEFVFIAIISLVFNLSAAYIIETQFGGLLSNVFITVVYFIIIRLNISIKIYNYILKTTDKISLRYLLIFSIMLVLFIYISGLLIYKNLSFGWLLVSNIVINSYFLFIAIYSFKTKNNYIKVYDKYNTTLNSLKEYEDILDRYRVSNHENKNQLLTIRNMIFKDDEKTVSYIDKIIGNKLKDNDKVMLDTSVIPTGGLRGLIYSKVLVIKEKGIDYDLEISHQIRTVDLIHKISDSTMLDVCQIIGVYIDNAIDEVENLKEGYINIEMYLDNKYLKIEISNNYKNKIEIDKLENKGYTTKKKGHGYGLTLTREIIEKNKLLSNEKRISKVSFTQVLKIKM